jgi:hypothetical protein
VICEIVVMARRSDGQRVSDRYYVIVIWRFAHPVVSLRIE